MTTSSLAADLDLADLRDRVAAMEPEDRLIGPQDAAMERGGQ